MNRVLFFRGLNLGNRRLTNPELASALESCGCGEVRIYQASGNAVVSDTRDEGALQEAVETGLNAALGYEVDTYVREPDELRALLSHPHWGGRKHTGKLQVAMVREAPDASVVAPFATDQDWLAVFGRQVLWWPASSILDTTLDLRTLEKTVGRWTQRTFGTVDRLTRKFLS
ncbi:MAG: DUF1697 domain-containing protein [Myxococcota bacterium]